MRELNETSPVDSLFKRSATQKISAGPPKVAPNHGTRVVAFESEAPHDVDDETVDESTKGSLPPWLNEGGDP